jgi:hypothetical protein
MTPLAGQCQGFPTVARTDTGIVFARDERTTSRGDDNQSDWVEPIRHCAAVLD